MAGPLEFKLNGGSVRIDEDSLGHPADVRLRDLFNIIDMTEELAQVLRHELTHSFIQQITHGRAPQWLHEGIAQVEEGRTTADFGPRLAALYAP